MDNPIPVYPLNFVAGGIITSPIIIGPHPY
jgi:hypothetical protein